MGSSGEISYIDYGLSKLQRPDLLITDAFIGGEWVRTAKKFSVSEPSTAGILCEVANCDRGDFKYAINDAFHAQQSYYESTTAAVRSAILRKWFDHIIKNKADLATILCLENGKTYAEAEGEIVYAASFVAWFAEEASRSYGAIIPSSMPNTSVHSSREPIGVCGIITPWNFPAAMITRKIAPAFAAGCAVVIKPPSETPLTCLALTRLAIEAGLPPKIIQVCPTKDREAATELATNPQVKKISFTGSTGVGKMLARLAAGTLKRLSLELGGNAPFIVFNDADLDLAVEGAMVCKFRCSGQTCVCANRFLVQSGVLAEFTKRLVAKVSGLKTGPGLHSGTTQGPLVNAAAVKKVEEHVTDAVTRGGKIEYQGQKIPSNGFYYPPTVISGVTEAMAVTSEETFGPLAPLYSFETEEEAVRLANDTEFGLAGYLFSSNVNTVARVSSKLQVGMVGVNTGKISAPEAPFGGVKESGYGREGSLYGLDEYQVIKSIITGNLDK